MPRPPCIVSASRAKAPAHPSSLWMVLDKPQSLSRPLILKDTISLDTSNRQGSAVVEGMDSEVHLCSEQGLDADSVWPQASPLLSQTWFFSSHFVVAGIRLCIQSVWGQACYTVDPELWGQVQAQSQAEALDQAQLPCPPSHATPASPPGAHLANGQSLIGAWGRTLSDGGEWARAGPTDKAPPDEGGLGSGALSWRLFPQVPPDMMGWPWLSCLLLPALVVSGRYLPSPISTNEGPSAELSRRAGCCSISKNLVPTAQLCAWLPWEAWGGIQPQTGELG